jgi:hypothetical protein
MHQTFHHRQCLQTSTPLAVRYRVSRRHHSVSIKPTNLIHPDCLYQFSLHATYLANQQQQQQQQKSHPRRPKPQDQPPVSFLTSYGDHGYALTPNGTVIALLNSQPYEFLPPSSSSSHQNQNQQILPNLKPRLATTFCGYNHAIQTPDPNTPLAFAIVTLFHPENRIVTNQKINPDPNKSKNAEEPPLNLENIRIVMACKGNSAMMGGIMGRRLL